jgi:serine/threonine protein kinase/predicted Zn-dependent protease
VEIDRYQVLEELGRGGMGAVYRAHDPALGRDVALKVMLTAALGDGEALARFAREGLTLGRLRHPGLVRLHQVGVSAGRAFLVMDLLPGGSLQARLRQGPLPVAEAAALVAKVAQAIEAAHEAGVLHRDLKPDNVMFDERGEPVVTDFGLAGLTAVDERLTKTGDLLGTPAYMAPEQAEGARSKIGPACDVYALGALLHACLTGHPPHAGRSVVEVLHSVLTRPPPAPSSVVPEVTPALDAVCLRCMARAPEDRYGSAAEVALALRPDETALTSSSAPPPWALALLALVAAAALGVLARVSLGPTGRSAPAQASTPSPPASAATSAPTPTPTPDLDPALARDVEATCEALTQSFASGQLAMAPPPDALADVEALLERGSHDARLHAFFAILAHGDPGRRPQVLASGRRALERGLDDEGLRAALLAQHARALSLSGFHREALDALDAFEALRPGELERDPRLRFRRGVTRVNVGQLAEGIEDLEAILEDPGVQPGWVWNSLALAFGLQGKWRRSLDAYVSTETAGSTIGGAGVHVAVAGRLGRARAHLRRGTLRAALEAATDVHAAQGAAPRARLRAHALHAEALLRQGRLDDAQEALQDGLRTMRDLTGPPGALPVASAELLLVAGRLDEALRQVERGIAHRPGDWRPYQLKAQILHAYGRPALAREGLAAAEAALALDSPPAPALARALRGHFLLQVDRHEEGRREILAALKRDPTLSLPHYVLGGLLLQDGRLDDALKQATAAMSQDGLGSPLPLYLRARVHQARGEADLARADVEQALRHALPKTPVWIALDALKTSLGR